LIHVNGLRYPWDYAKLLWSLNTVKPRCLAVKSALVLPEYWSTGVAIALSAELLRRGMERGYTWVDLSITSADNPNSVPLAENLGARIYKRWQVYRLDIPT
jgi:GNAT superfamily N-acetyltransferase